MDGISSLEVVSEEESYALLAWNVVLSCRSLRPAVKAFLDPFNLQHHFDTVRSPAEKKQTCSLDIRLCAWEEMTTRSPTASSISSIVSSVFLETRFCTKRLVPQVELAQQ